MRSTSGAASSSFATDDDRAVVAPACARDLLARQQSPARARRRPRPSSANAGIVGDQDALRRGVVLGLGQQVGGDPVRIVGAVRDDEDFRRPGDGVDADPAEHLALGGGDIGVAGPDDLVDGRDGRACHRPAPPRPARRRRDRSRVTPARLAAASTSGLILPPLAGVTMRCARRRRRAPARRSSAPSWDRPRCRPARKARRFERRPAPAELSRRSHR